MSEIFLSYRRTDSQSATGRLADDLQSHFGRERVFRDHDSIIAGADFAQAIERAIAAAAVVLVIIGPRWLQAGDAGGRRRIDDPADFVRLEIEAALNGGVPVVPVLVEGATMPGASDVPASLAAFTRCQAVELSETRWRFDVDRLSRSLEERFAIESLPESAVTLAGNAPRAGRWLTWAARLAIDLLDLATHPTRLILRRQSGRASDHVRAFGFLVGALAVGNLLMLQTLRIPPLQPRGALGDALHLLVLVLTGVVLCFLLIAGMLSVLALAWRLAGTRIEFRQLSLVLAYIASGVWVGLCLGAFAFGVAMEFSDEQAFGRIATTLWPARSSLPAATAWSDRVAVAERDFAALFSNGPVQIGFLLANVIWLATACWLVVAWRAFHLSFRVSAWRALLATAIWLALLGLIGLVIERLVTAG